MTVTRHGSLHTLCTQYYHTDLDISRYITRATLAVRIFNLCSHYIIEYNDT